MNILPLAFLVYSALLGICLDMPKEKFAELLVYPVPSSVHNLRVSGMGGIIGEYWGFHFHIDPDQLEKMLKEGGYKPEANPSIPYLAYFFCEKTKLGFETNGPFKSYISGTYDTTFRIVVHGETNVYAQCIRR